VVCVEVWEGEVMGGIMNVGIRGVCGWMGVVG
jgi:hypothetical protein